MINELDDRMSTVKRWGILRTIRTQSVAEQCFNVQRICIRLAPVLGIFDEDIFLLSQAALHHDDKEAIIGDIPSTAKRYLRIQEIHLDVMDQAWYDLAPDRIKMVVKLADMLEMYHFLTLELHMGNAYVYDHRTRLINLINDHIKEGGKKIGWPDELGTICTGWMTGINEAQTSQTFERNDDEQTAGSD